MGRKRANKKVEAAPPKKVMPLTKVEMQYFQELIDASQRYEAVMKQKAQYEFAIKRMEEDRKKIQTGELDGKFTITVIPKLLSREVKDKKEILELFDSQLKTYKDMVKALNGQLEHRYEEYVESGLRNKDFLTQKFGKLTVKHIAPDRRTAKKEEEVLFEAEFEKLLKDPEVQKEFKEAKEEAVKRNKEKKE